MPGSRRHDMILCLHDFSDFWYGWRKQLRGLSGQFPSLPCIPYCLPYSHRVQYRLVYTVDRTVFPIPMPRTVPSLRTHAVQWDIDIPSGI